MSYHCLLPGLCSIHSWSCLPQLVLHIAARGTFLKIQIWAHCSPVYKFSIVPAHIGWKSTTFPWTPRSCMVWPWLMLWFHGCCTFPSFCLLAAMDLLSNFPPQGLCKCCHTAQMTLLPCPCCTPSTVPQLRSQPRCPCLKGSFFWALHFKLFQLTVGVITCIIIIYEWLFDICVTVDCKLSEFIQYLGHSRYSISMY